MSKGLNGISNLTLVNKKSRGKPAFRYIFNVLNDDDHLAREHDHDPILLQLLVSLPE